MGREALVQARFGEAAEAGKLQWEAPSLIFRGVARRSWTGPALAGVVAEGDDLVLADGARFTLGAVQAARWGQAIANPPGRLDKLGVKAGQKVALVGLKDAAFVAELSQRAPPVKDKADLDLVFLAADSLADLDAIAGLIPTLASGGAIWVVSSKGKAAAIKDVDVMAAARPLGLVDTKVCAFSDTHTALRFTRRKA